MIHVYTVSVSCVPTLAPGTGVIPSQYNYSTQTKQQNYLSNTIYSNLSAYLNATGISVSQIPIPPQNVPFIGTPSFYRLNGTGIMIFNTTITNNSLNSNYSVGEIYTSPLPGTPLNYQSLSMSSNELLYWDSYGPSTALYTPAIDKSQATTTYYQMLQANLIQNYMTNQYGLYRGEPNWNTGQV